MKTIAQFRIYKDDGTYVAEGVDLAIISQADSLDALVKNLEEAVALHLEGEDIKSFDFAQKPSILVNFEVPQHA